MKKILAGLFVTMVAALSALGFAPSAQAVDCPGYDTQVCGENIETTPPKPSNVEVSPANASVENSQSGILPNTGGPEGVLLIGGAALLAVGGAAVVVARRRQTH
jgi:LPXTG-motif cell wall-anchored protein